MKRILIATALVAVAAFSVPAFAASTSKPPNPMKVETAKPAAAATPATGKAIALSFKQIDANHDGKISYDELKKYNPTLTKDEFAKYDANKDGFYDHTELAAFYKGQQAAAKTSSATTPVKPVTKPVTTAKLGATATKSATATATKAK